MKVTALSGSNFRDFVIGGYNNLKANKAQVDALNVFPVPDGDTGTNMFLTVQSATREIEQITDISLGSVATALSKGSLMGARGNSGVILSQIFRGIGQSLSRHQEASAQHFAEAMQCGVDTAYKAVMKPVEGTILTVSKACAKEALKAARDSDDIIEVLNNALIAGAKALALTPEQLPVLKQAGVVDAGGKGLLVILEGGLKALTGDMTYEIAQVEEHFIDDHNLEASDINFRYCTEFLISGQDIKINIITNELDDWGDSLLVVGTDELVKVHIHTNRPGYVLEKCMEYGELHHININNMVDQNKGITANSEPGKANTEEKEIGVVAVAAGAGLVELLKSMGVDNVVTGGQTMNPSTEDLLAAIEQVPAKKIIILPNNSNIILAAKQARELCENKEIAIIPTKTFPQALAALLVYDGETEFEKLVANMTDNIENVITGEITYAIRDSQYNQLEIKAGQILGLIDNEISVTGDQIETVLVDMLKNMISEESELITLFYGEDVQKQDAEKLVANLGEIFPQQEIELHSGEQKLYYYIIAVE
ncbi:MAG: DAK2 domain-containing protein [Bacillota bacterium]|nr:DAK2 domain-containing protein [Bacillota bacterium]